MEKLRNFCEYRKVYTDEQEKLIGEEFARVKGHYLEHAGATLYSERQIQDVFTELSKNMYGNPHGGNTVGKLTEDLIDQMRYEILEHFSANSNEYSVIFTSGTTASLKLIAESFVYESGSPNESGSFVYLIDNHTSVLGMRQYAHNTEYFTQSDIIEALSKVPQNNLTKLTNSNSLIAYPAQSNFSGTKYPLWWIKEFQNGALNGVKNLNSKHWFVLLDAACLVYNDRLDLSEYKPDFVTVSFYKIFGYPTGVGALLVKNSSAWCLQKKYFGGGTVLMALGTENVMIPRNVLHERFEDGTLSFLSILAVKHGFATLKRLNLKSEHIAQHTFELARYIYRNLLSFHHYNGKPVAVVYNDTRFAHARFQGGILNFNLLRCDGEYVGYSEVLHIANLYGIHLRTGCACNPGACQMHLNLTAKDVRHHFNEGHICGDQKDLIDGYPTGSVRISFGYMSKKENADAFLNMVQDYFIAKPLVKKIPQQWNAEDNNIMFVKPCRTNNEVDKTDLCSDIYTEKLSILHDKSEHLGFLEKIYLYPVKSCGAFSVSSDWEVASTGLKYDHQWMITDSSGVCVTQKRNHYLCLIKPHIDLKNDTLTLHCEGYTDVSIPLKEKWNVLKDFSKCHSKVCTDRIIGWDCGDEVAAWLSDVLRTDGLRLLRQCSNNTEEISRISKTGNSLSLSLANKAQYLLINMASVQWLHDAIPKDAFADDIDSLVRRFRPNLLINFYEPLIENDFQQITIDGITFKCEGNCTRCQMICIDQHTAEKTAEPLKTLSRKLNGKIAFGVYLRRCLVDDKCNIKVGSIVTAK